MKDLLNKGVKNLNKVETDKLCAEIRTFLVEKVSKTGGHLSPNLGVVELTVAMHKVFDSLNDRFIFDVGHQSYVHKILTGRHDKFDTLRKKNGLSGFTKPSESPHDAFVSGHASVSISAALGMAHARTLSKSDKSIVAVIGDGALTGGLAYEALNNAGTSQEPLIVILNDNVMSISENVGAMSTHLSHLRLTSKYQNTKKTVHKLTKNSDKIDSVIRKFKQKVKLVLLETSFFEQMGFTYIGQVDGHNVDELCYVLQKAKELQKPVLIHVKTIKGKGYKFSEEKPDIFHGISPFCIDTGEILSKTSSNFSKNFGESLSKIAETNKKVCAITAAMSSGTGLTTFAEKFPDRFFDVGIAEAHAVTMSAGLASLGYTPVCALYSTFLQRAYDQLIHDISIEKLHVVFAIDRAGIVGDDGETHNGVFDIPMALSIPNFKILAPSNYLEQENMLNIAINDTNSPYIIRYPRGTQGKFALDTSATDFAVFGDSKKLTVITYGTLVNSAYDLLETEDFTLLKINDLSLDLSKIKAHINRKIIVIEDCVNTGSFASKLALYLQLNAIETDYFKALNTGDKFTKQATTAEVFADNFIDKNGVLKYIKEAHCE